MEQLERRDCPDGGFLYNPDGSYRGYTNDPVGMVRLNPAAEALLHAPTIRADLPAVQAALMVIPPAVGQWFTDHGGRVVTYPGQAVTDIPQFAVLKGVRTGAGGDGDRTYDEVPAFTLGATVYTNAVVADYVTHEVGHGIEYLLPAAWVTRWGVEVMPAMGDWNNFPGRGPTDYYRDNPMSEGFAEGFALYVAHNPNEPAVMRTYFTDLWSVL